MSTPVQIRPTTRADHRVTHHVIAARDGHRSYPAADPRHA